jgi:hypothetical protein
VGYWRPQSGLVRRIEIPQPLTGQPFRADDARALGLSWKTLQGTRFRRIAQGVYVAADSAETHRMRVRGVLCALPGDTIVTGVTGLQLLGVDVGPELPMTFATTHPRQIRRPNVKVVRLKHLPPHRDRIASAEHCWLIAAATLNLLDLVTAGDWLLRRRRTTLGRLQAAVREYSGRGVVPARRAVNLVRQRVDSPRETWLRLCLVLAGLPTPECNVIIGDDRGPMGRVDLVYLAYKLILEYEGDQHRTDRNQWNADIDRYEDFARDKWTLIRVTSERARWPRHVVRTVYQALRANGYQGPPPEFSQLWISLFE